MLISFGPAWGSLAAQPSVRQSLATAQRSFFRRSSIADACPAGLADITCELEIRFKGQIIRERIIRLLSFLVVMKLPFGREWIVAIERDGQRGGDGNGPRAVEVLPETQSVADAIRRIAHGLDVRSKRVARECGFTVPQIVVLEAVRDCEGATTGEISRRARLSAATAVAILEKLEARGIVERLRSRQDRRIVHTRLTAVGAELLAGAPPPLAEAFYSGMAALEPDERATLARAFRTVAGFIDRQEEASEDGDRPPTPAGRVSRGPR
jgi:DNA-binding MarR family transcriptional regulator